MWRGLKPALARRDENYSLLMLFLISSIAIALFYGSGTDVRETFPAHHSRVLALVGRPSVGGRILRSLRDRGHRVPAHQTRIAVDCDRNARRALLDGHLSSGASSGLFTICTSLERPTSVLALGAIFSALEVVPLVLIGFEAWENMRLTRGTARNPWISAYKWPIYFFVAVAFWNFVGAGLFGFMINPPMALYYMQGLNLTPVHGHTALFGVYGMLGIGLMLFCLRALRPGLMWKDRPLAIAFWSINIGLATMVLLSTLPIGLAQAWASVEIGTWYARSSEFLHTPMLTRLRWMRMFGDTIFAFGAIVLGWFVLGLVTGHSFDRGSRVMEEGEYTPQESELVHQGD